jgi:glycerol kinase
MSQYILAIDQGTTGSTALIIDDQIQVIAKANVEYPQIYPQPGWVEHRPEDILNSVKQAIALVFEQSDVKVNQISGIGITNQRETVVLWDQKTAKPSHNAIVWQCRRTADDCQKLKDQGLEPLFRSKTGLCLDPYFSGTKMRWLLKNSEYSAHHIFGTIDTFLVWHLTSGEVHVTDVSNASRTLLMSLDRCEWDDELCDILEVPKSMLPKICSSSEIYGYTKGFGILPDGIPIAGIAGDQQAALFGQACFHEGQAKCTYGTGAFLLMNTGHQSVSSENGLLTTVAWKIKDEVTYALEGSAFIAGAAVQWLRDGLKMISTAAEIEDLAKEVVDNGGVYFVPALTGLGSPYWDPNARGVICGLTRGSNRGHLARATLEGIAYQNVELLEAMQKDSGQALSVLKVDGGASANGLLMQIQADLLQSQIIRPKSLETTALGCALLAGLALGIWQNLEEIEAKWKVDACFKPEKDESSAKLMKQGWKKAVEKALLH